MPVSLWGGADGENRDFYFKIKILLFLLSNPSVHPWCQADFIFRHWCLTPPCIPKKHLTIVQIHHCDAILYSSLYMYACNPNLRITCTKNNWTLLTDATCKRDGWVKGPISERSPPNDTLLPVDARSFVYDPRLVLLPPAHGTALPARVALESFETGLWDQPGGKSNIQATDRQTCTF